jgi:hypothetical protein
LNKDKLKKSSELHQQFHEEAAQNPRMLQDYRHTFACLEANDQEVSRVAKENRAWRADGEKKKTAKIAEMKKKKKASGKAKYAPRKPQRCKNTLSQHPLITH